MTSHRSPPAPEAFPDLPPVAGVRTATTAAGIRYRARTDVLLVDFAPGTSVGGVFSTSQTAGAPVGWCRRILPAGRARGLVANAGNSNVHTGPGGAIATEETAKAAARVLGCPSEEIYVTSTGIIGVPLPYEKITAALPQLGRELRSGGFRAAAEAIRTTDTYAKGATRMADIGGTRVVINGIAKGSGMIAPNMATMHAFVFTDAALPAAVLQALIARAVDESFNCITVDSDTSTSDTVLLFATGQGPAHPAIGDPGDRRLSDFRAKLGEVTRDLAHQIVRDGEGATKFMAITVSGAASRRAARRIALAIANSPLVKTAAAGGDPNWGRIVAAVGKAGERATRDKLRIWIGEQLVAAGGGPVPGWDEAQAARYMKNREIAFAVDVGVGRGRATVWTCDLGHGYIDINADYTS